MTKYIKRAITHTVEYYPSTKKDTLPFATVRMHLEGIALRGMREKDGEGEGQTSGRTLSASGE